MNANFHSAAMHIGPFYHRDLDASRNFGSMAVDEQGPADEGCRIPIWKHVLDAILLLLCLPVALPCMVMVGLWIARRVARAGDGAAGKDRKKSPMFSDVSISHDED